jgi:hypothetical protein
MQTLSADRIRDWQRRAEQARWIKEARHGRPVRELVAAALGPLGIRRVPPARPMAGRTGTAERQSAAADGRQSAGTR